MKTLDEFIDEICVSETLKKEIQEVRDRDALEAFLKKYEVSGTADDFIKAVNSRREAEGGISDDEAEGASGGFLPHIWDVTYAPQQKFR